MHQCNHCNYSTKDKSNLRRHYKSKHKSNLQRHYKSKHSHENKFLLMDSENYDTPITEYQQPVMIQKQTGQKYEQAMKNIECHYNEHITKLKEALQCQQHKHNQELKNLHYELQHQHNRFVESLQKHHQMEKENLSREYQKCIDQTGLQFQKALENKIEDIYKESQDCINQTGIQWQQALNCKQNQYNKMKEYKDDLQDCIGEYLQARDKPKGKYCCLECGKGWKHYDEYLFHMKKHEK